jgi:hypothetical protein
MWSGLELALALSASEVATRPIAEPEDSLYWSMQDLEMKAKHRLREDFIASCASGAIHRLKELLRKPCSAIGKGLIAAAKNGHVECVQLLLPLSPFNNVLTALEEACHQGHGDVIAVLGPTVNRRLEGRIAISRLLPQICAQARFDIGRQLLSFGTTTQDEALAETLSLLWKEWTESAEDFAITLIQTHKAKLTYTEASVCRYIFRQSPTQFIRVLVMADILPRPLCLPAERWYQLMTDGMDIEPYLPFGIYPESIVALTQKTRLLMLEILPIDLINSIVMPYLGCPQRNKRVVEVDFSEIERCLDEPKPLPETPPEVLPGSLASLFIPP